MTDHNQVLVNVLGNLEQALSLLDDQGALLAAAQLCAAVDCLRQMVRQAPPFASTRWAVSDLPGGDAMGIGTYG